MHNIHKGEKSDVGIRQEDAARGETNGEIIAGEEETTESVYETGTPREKGIKR